MRTSGSFASVPETETLRALLQRAEASERRGALDDAISAYGRIVDAPAAEAAVLAIALRRLGNIHRRRHELDRARALTLRSYEVAAAAGEALIAAEAVNGLALIHLARGEWDQARAELQRAIDTGCDAAMRARIEQNLGIMANVEGALDVALAHYERCLEYFEADGNVRGCAGAYNNIGMNHADREMWDQADHAFRASLELADSLGDVQLRGFALLNRTEVHLARQQFEVARRSIDEALQIFEQLGVRDMKAEAYKFLGVLYRETGRPELAEAQLRAAVELASDVGATLAQAEATRELALLYGQLGRNQDTLAQLSASHRLFGRLHARRDLVDVASKLVRLQNVYLDVVKQWGASIESSDMYTYGHSSRVADYSVAIAQTFGLTGTDLTTIRVGAHLHDVGKIRVPYEILNKPGKLSAEEFACMKQHPIYGIEMLAKVDFPWDVKPIIRSHHEKLDGSGYPDRLRGDEIPLTAQLVCAADVYDALTTTRSYRGALPHETALATMRESVRWWRSDVFEAFMESVGTTGPII